MPPHSSYLLQLLDVACFGPLKRIYGGLVEERVRGRYNHFDKSEFLDIYYITHDEAFKPGNIKSSFTAAAIHLFNY